MSKKIRLFTVITSLTIWIAFCLAPAALGGQKVLRPRLSNVARGKGWTVVNRKASYVKEHGKKIVRFDERDGVGLGWLDGVKFKDGTIEFDVRGRDVVQKSFVGIAFQAVDDASCDIVYFRPFNFKTDNPESRKHAVQYMAPPDYGWKKLREDSPGKYENPIVPVADPSDWFHVRVTVQGRTVSVYVNNAKEPTLVVEKLIESREGKIGLWLGDKSNGDFADLKITSAE